MALIMITGANRGIGLGLVQQYLAKGDQVVAACRDPAASALQKLRTNPNVQIITLDVGDQQSIADAANSLGGQTIDLLINNAGIGGGDEQSLHTIDPDQWLHVLRINALSPLLVTRALLPNLSLAEAPKVMMISSQLGAISYPNISLYAYESSKAALNKVVRGMAHDLRDRGIAVFAIHPGWVKTDMGGPNAAISVEESARGLVSTFDKLTIENSGSFWQWNGTEHAW